MLIVLKCLLFLLTAVCVLYVNGALTSVKNLCSPNENPAPLVRGRPTYVCVNINDQYRSVFMPRADQFTVLRIANSLNDSRIGGNPKGAFLTVSSLTSTTPYKLYSSPAGKIYPFYTAIISVKKGAVTGISWDDGCYFCDPMDCEPNLYRAPTNKSSQIYGEGKSCFSNATTCEGANATTCDLTIYVGWTGTDANGNYLASSGLRMSQFQKYSVSNYFKNVKSEFTKFMPASRFDY